MPPPMPRSPLQRVKRLVVKVGTGTLTDGQGRFEPANCARVAEDLAEVARGRRLVLVSSGAVAIGADKLGLVRSKGKPWDIPTKQAAAAVGQPHLMAAWGEALGVHGLRTAQVLLTADDLASRQRFLNARRTFAKLLELGVIPVVNENDTVAVDEIKVGDNDTLAALVAACIEADATVMLTDVEGLYDRNPSLPGAVILHDVPRVTAEIERIAGGAGTERSTGGMATKVRAARRLAAQGVVDGAPLRPPGASAPGPPGRRAAGHGLRPERRAAFLAQGVARRRGPRQGHHPRGCGRPAGPLGPGPEPAPQRGTGGRGAVRDWAIPWTSRWNGDARSRAGWPATPPTRCAGSPA